MLALGFPAHLVFELAAYVVSASLFLLLRARHGDAVASSARWTLLAAAAVGASVGARVLSWFVEPAELAAHALDPVWLIQQKTILGALLGGWAAVELAKRRLALTTRTGDLYAVPLCAGIAVGRIGCFLDGLADRTYGRASTLPWAVDLGDGVPRHPVALYESVFVLALGALLLRRMGRPHREGALFRAFMAAYAGFRLLADGLKPAPAFLGLAFLQWVSLGTLVLVLALERRAPRPRLA